MIPHPLFAKFIEASLAYGVEKSKKVKPKKRKKREKKKGA